MVDAEYRGLKTSFRAHADASASLGETPSGWMLLFYSVECGFKAELLHRHGRITTPQLESTLKSHDLRRLAKELKLPPPYVPNCRMKREGGIVEAQELHAAWRYGRLLEQDDQVDAVHKLRRLYGWCKEVLGV